MANGTKNEKNERITTKYGSLGLPCWYFVCSKVDVLLTRWQIVVYYIVRYFSLHPKLQFSLIFKICVLLWQKIVLGQKVVHFFLVLNNGPVCLHKTGFIHRFIFVQKDRFSRIEKLFYTNIQNHRSTSGVDVTLISIID